MGSVVYAIVFKGEVLEGFQVISVKAHMAQLLKAGPEQMVKLFSGKQIVLKKTTDKAIAIKYGGALKKVGADIRIRAVQVDAEPAAKPTTPDSGSTINTNFELLPNVGNIFDPGPTEPPPEIHISNLELAPVGEGTLGQPQPEVEVEVDISGIELAEPGVPLVVEPKPEAPKIEPPDFGLDKPGAVLETLHEEVELVHPDISGITLAAPGTDLLNEEERDHKETPPAPDISKFQLVSD